MHHCMGQILLQCRPTNKKSSKENQQKREPTCLKKTISNWGRVPLPKEQKEKGCSELK